tara:strand:+ start:6489 stop:7040 length:552 start_codon:yes stop_codon:yes gene_type:complete
MKLHLGCWHRNIPGFVHVDLCDMDHIDYQSRIDDLPMFDDNSVSLIYSSHSFEYFDRFEASIALKEWYRILKPNGVLRLAVPNFDSLIKVYNTSGEIEDILGPLFGRMKIQTQSGEKAIYHRTAYNFKGLSKILLENNFSEIKKYKWQDTIHKDYDDHSQAYYPHLDKENGLLVSLNVESVKK